MNRFLIPLLILLGSLLYSWFWNCQRRPHCSDGEYAIEESIDAVADESEAVISEDDGASAMAAEEMTEAEEEELLFTPLDVYFETAKNGISKNAEIENFLNTAQKYLAAHRDKKLSLVGHTDNDGSDATNDPLSVKRANTVKEMLINEGFEADQLVTSGRGEREPIASNDTPEGRAKNRRVTIRLME
ncbi:OmpA family protein [Jiulongibacter sediminis]|uniref:OmpA family protein n=1 Tax=Jiulongibacter sediminis TaxID=1605367 RepID=UPI0006DC39ED|nr:OmpA family protein [Jiulongibacter sediminis]